MSRSLSVIGCLPILVLVAPACLASTVWDLKADWNTTANGKYWSYRQDTSLLTYASSWAGWSGAEAWAPACNCVGHFLPAIIRVKSNSGPWLADDIGIHAEDPANGVGQGQANVAWTSSSDGLVNIQGSLWDGSNRAAVWSLRLGSKVISAGNVPPR